MGFRFVQYGNRSYPDGIVPDLTQLPGHFDVREIRDCPRYSLHTEFSYGKRAFSSNLISEFTALRKAARYGVPQLWKSEEWAAQFALFIFRLTEGHAAPVTIEVHPPFDDYGDLDDFLTRYVVFESMIHEEYPDTEIVIENHAGTLYRGGKFLIGTSKEIIALCSKILDCRIQLGIVLDFLQLMSAEYIQPDAFDKRKYDLAVDALIPYREVIRGIHVWGKKKNAAGKYIAHAGNLDTLFPDSFEKAAFLDGIYRICSDGRTRYLVPEVNSSEEDLQAIIRDVLSLGL